MVGNANDPHQQGRRRAGAASDESGMKRSAAKYDAELEDDRVERPRAGSVALDEHGDNHGDDACTGCSAHFLGILGVCDTRDAN